MLNIIGLRRVIITFRGKISHGPRINIDERLS